MSPEDLVLVAVVPSRRDLDIARVLGWYRIPLQTAPKVVRADWLAFYLPGCFQSERWSIRYVARIKGVELCTREQLLAEYEHPRAQEPYYKLQLSSIQTLSKPIQSKRWRRLTFLYTSGAKFLAAEGVKDLILSASERQILWRII